MSPVPAEDGSNPWRDLNDALKQEVAGLQETRAALAARLKASEAEVARLNDALRRQSSSSRYAPPGGTLPVCMSRN